MSNVFFSSDLHFGHNRAFLYEPRGFKSIEEHDAAIIRKWNTVVQPEDTVYLLGDLMLNDNEGGIEKLNQLNGHIVFIRGNHDSDARCILYNEKTNMQPADDASCLTSWAAVVKVQGFHFYLSHYPTITSSVENMAPLKHHLINLHGHTHSKNAFYQDMPFCYNVALDAHANYPVSFNTIIADIERKKEECLAML